MLRARLAMVSIHFLVQKNSLADGFYSLVLWFNFISFMLGLIFICLCFWVRK